MVRRRRGMTLIEVLTALPLAALVAAGLLEVLWQGLKSFEKHESVAAAPAWQAAERLFAFLDMPLRHCGAGLPESWESDLFAPSLSLSSMPPWSLWKRPLSAGNSVRGKGFRAVDASSWGNTLRLVSAVPSGAILTQRLELEAGVSRQAFFSSPIKSESTLGLASSVSWVLFPGTELPVRMTSGGNTASPKVLSRRGGSVPWGTPLCRLMAVTLCADGGVLYGDFCDGSGNQPLFRGIEKAEFRVDPLRHLVTVRLGLKIDESGRLIEEKRSWHWE